MIIWTQLGLQEAISPVIEEFLFFHDFVILIILLIISFVGYLILTTMFNQFLNKKLLENQILESIWTFIPGIILIQIAIPSISLLYLFEESLNANMTVKVIGHQWYWSYEYWNFLSNTLIFNFDSYIIELNSKPSQFRLLEVDSRLTLPFRTNIQMLITSGDVLHAWTVPSLGIKADATPGRLNQLNFIRLQSGVYYGQCSEICGANHRFIPIVLELVDTKDFLTWISLIKEYI
jgi:cytochrome c oxidase subunit 2